MQKRHSIAFSLAAVALAAGLSLTGCQLIPGMTTNPNPSPTAAMPAADVEACEHMAEGPAVAISAATLAATESLPTVNEAHKRYDITLPASGSQYVGKVQYNSSEAADYVLFFDRNVALKLTNAEGQEVEIEESATSSVVCTSIKGRHVVPLGVGAYTLQLGPTDAASVSLVIEEAAHEDHGHE